MRVRLATASLGIPIIVFCVWIGGFLFTFLVGTLTAFATYELARIAKSWGDCPNKPFVVGASISVVCSTLFYDPLGDTAQAIGLITTGLALISAFYLLYISPIRGIQNTALSSLTITGLISGTMIHAPLLRGLDNGFEWTILLLTVGFSTDTGAYVIGRCFGRLKLAPSISPGKTWEGAIAGSFCGILACVVGASVLGLQISSIKSGCLGAVLAVTGHMGDLIESQLKRQAGVKNSSLFVPGHGGVLDRLDSIVWILVVVYHFRS